MTTSQNGRYEVRVRGNQFELRDCTGQSIQVMNYIEPNDMLLSISDDAQWVYLARQTSVPSLKILHLNLRNGTTELVTEVTVNDLAGVVSLGRVSITPDGRVLILGYVRHLSELHLMQRGD